MRGHAGFTFLGRIAKDPSMRTLENRTTKRLSVTAVANVPYFKDGEWKENATWITFAWFGDMAVKMAERLRKGQWVFITGEIRSMVEEVGEGQKVTRYIFRPSTVIPWDVVTKDMREQLSGGEPIGGDAGGDDMTPADGDFNG